MQRSDGGRGWVGSHTRERQKSQYLLSRCRKTKHPDLHKWFCVETIKVCCPKGTFGRDCNCECGVHANRLPLRWFSFRFLSRNECIRQRFGLVAFVACVGGSERPCHGNGVCDGDGTRGGNGKCSCNHGYTGEFCLDCIEGHFNEERNDTFSLCTGDFRTVGFIGDRRKRRSSLKLGFERFLQSVTHPAKRARERPIRTVRSAKKAGRKPTRKLVSVRSSTRKETEYRIFGINAQLI